MRVWVFPKGGRHARNDHRRHLLGRGARARVLAQPPTAVGRSGDRPPSVNSGQSRPNDKAFDLTIQAIGGSNPDAVGRSGQGKDLVCAVTAAARRNDIPLDMAGVQVQAGHVL